MRSLFLTISRFAVAAWVGAAVLFVYASLLEVRSPDLDSSVKSLLAVLRFPAYYQFGFGLILTALVAGAIARGHPAVRRWRMRLYLALLVVSLVVMLCDYVWIYQPLAAMTARAAHARPARFGAYHTASQWANTAHVSLCLLAALLIAWPSRRGAK